MTKLVSASISFPKTRQVFENPGNFDDSRVWKITLASPSSMNTKPSWKRILRGNINFEGKTSSVSPKYPTKRHDNKKLQTKTQNVLTSMTPNKNRIVLLQTIWFVSIAHAKQDSLICVKKANSQALEANNDNIWTGHPVQKLTAVTGEDPTDHPSICVGVGTD